MSSSMKRRTIELFRLVEHDGKTGRDARAEMAKLPEPSRFVTGCECSYPQPDVLSGTITADMAF